MRKTIPNCESEQKEQIFWAATDSTEYLDGSQAKRVVLPKLKPSVKTISLRLPSAMLGELRVLERKGNPNHLASADALLASRAGGA